MNQTARQVYEAKEFDLLHFMLIFSFLIEWKQRFKKKEIQNTRSTAENIIISYFTQNAI